MKHNLRYSPAALRDLDDIWDYIAVDLCNPNAAEKIINGILDTITPLEEFAEMGTPLNAIAAVVSDYRYLLHEKYLVFYRVGVEDVFIDRILHGSRNYLRILFDDKK